MQSILALAISINAAFSAPVNHTPIIGDLKSTTAKLWVRDDSGQVVTVTLDDATNGFKYFPTTKTDSTVTFTLPLLKPDTRYEYSINGIHKKEWWFQTRSVLKPDVKIAFGSCANELEGSSKVWDRLDDEEITALVLLGDTPYIDTTDLDIQRSRYQAFAEVPAFANLVSHTPLYSMWDDHDFGRNDTDGNLEGKENSRKAFKEYRPNPSFGENEQGIYTSFVQGLVEVFLLDARWFAKTEGNEAFPTLLGKQQWAWLEEGLKNSTSPYKVLACGMVFNDSVRPGKTDCWGRYPVEYARLLSVIKKTNATGVVLVSGDVHWSRVIKHETKSKIGYDLIEFVTSPIHEKLIEAANPPDKRLLFSKGEINTFLLLETKTKDEKTELTMKVRNAGKQTLHKHTFKVPPRAEE